MPRYKFEILIRHILRRFGVIRILLEYLNRLGCERVLIKIHEERGPETFLILDRPWAFDFIVNVLIEGHRV